MIASQRATHEVEHGRRLAHGRAELTWGWDTPAGRVRARRRAALIADAAGLMSGVRALEVGCGTGLFTQMFAATGATIVAVDISPDLLQLAQARRLDPRQVRFVQRRLEDCDVDDDVLVAGPGRRFDAAIGSSVLHHLDVRPALERLRQLVVPGGRIAFAEPNMLNPQVFMERRFRRLFPYVSPDESAIVRWPFAELLRASGFEEIAVVPFDWLHPSTPSSLISLVSGIGAVVERMPLLREFAGSVLISARCQR